MPDLRQFVETELPSLTLGPEEIGQMNEAYERVLQELGANDRAALVNEAVARKIIEVVQGGERDPDRISSHVRLALGVPKHSS
jgi:hypothetical protein